MVLPPPTADDAPGAPAADWLRPLKRSLRLSRAGVLLLVNEARPQSLGELVRALLPEHPELEVYTEVRHLVEAAPGSVLVLAPRPGDADWLNLNRPLFSHRALRVVLFCDSETTLALAHQAVDFFDWISHHVKCPSYPPRHGVEGLRCALAARVPGVVWTGGDLEASFALARPGRVLHRISAARPYPELVAEVRTHGRDWLAWSDVDSLFHLRRVRWALAESRRRTKAILVEPAVESPGWWKVHGCLAALREARERLEKAGAQRPGRLAALTGLEPEALELVAALLGRGVEEKALETEFHPAEDPGAVAGRMAVEHGLVSRHALARSEAPAPVLRAWASGREQRQEARRLREVELTDVSRRIDGTEPPGYEESGWWAAWATRISSSAPLKKLTPRSQAFAAEVLLRSSIPSARQEAAVLAIEAGDPDVAERWALRALKMGIDVVPLLARIQIERGHPLESESTLESHPALGNPLVATYLAFTIGNLQKADQLLPQQLSELESTLGTEHPLYADALLSVALVLSQQGKYSEAEAAARQAVTINDRVLGTHHPQQSHSRIILATILGKQGRISEAETMARQALSDLELSIGIEHPDYARSQTELASILLRQGRYAEAEELLQHALKIVLLVLGPDDIRVAVILTILAQTQHIQGKPEARETARQALAAIHDGPASEHSKMRNLPSVLQAILGEEQPAPGS